MRTVRVIGGILVIILAGLLGAYAATVYESRQASTNEPKSPSDSLQMDGWTPMTADPHWSLQNIDAFGTKSLDPNRVNYDVVITRISGTVPYTTGHNTLAAVDDEYSISLDTKQQAELETNGSICLYSGLVVQLPSTDLSDLDQRMDDCNSLSTVAMTVIISEVM